jgi:uncharacterized protein (DUF1015 family)
MANIVPFKAVRPTRDKVSLVTSRSYDEYSAAELASQLEFNPLSFLHVLNPAYTNLQKLDFEKRFRQVHQKYQEFKDDGILVKDEIPSVYIHRIVSKENIFTGIIAATCLDDYKADLVKRHEDTLEYRVKLFKDYIKISGFNTEPVLMTYPDNAFVAEWISHKTNDNADFEFSTTRNDIHYLWKISDPSEIAALQDTFKAIGSIYIADGHHRSASAELLYDENPSIESRKYFMSFLIPDSNVKIYEYNRLVKDLNGLSAEEFLQRLSKCFVVSPSVEKRLYPRSRHQFSIYIGNTFYLLTLKEPRNLASPIDRLDAQILYETVLLPILGISDLRNDDRIEYISGKQPLDTFLSKIDSGEFEVGFVLFPSDIAEIKSVADAHLTMPPKSTYIEPKFRSGLVIYEL